MNGGTISGNTASNGGGVYYFGTFNTFNMSGGTISGNTANSGGGVFVSNATFTVSGSPKIEGNKQGSGGTGTGGVYLSNGKTITIDSAHLTTGASIGIEGMDTTDEGTTVATNAVEGDLQYFYISNADKKIGDNNALVFDSVAIKLATVATPITVTGPSSYNQNFAALQDAVTAINGASGKMLDFSTGIIFITANADVTFDNITISSSYATLYANGHNVVLGNGIGLNGSNNTFYAVYGGRNIADVTGNPNISIFKADGT